MHKNKSINNKLILSILFSATFFIVKTELTHSWGIRDYEVDEVLKPMANFFGVPETSFWIKENKRNCWNDIEDFSIHIFSMNSNEVEKLKSTITSKSFLDEFTTHSKKDDVLFMGKFDFSSHPSTEEIEGNTESSSTALVVSYIS